MDYKTIIFEKRDGVAYITLNRPDEANALDLATATELHEAALDCDQDAGVRAILITANGKMFCGGGDLKFFHGSDGSIESLLMQVTLQFHRAISLFNRMDAPVVMAINGTAAGVVSVSRSLATSSSPPNPPSSSPPIPRPASLPTAVRPICCHALSACAAPRN